MELESGEFVEHIEAFGEFIDDALECLLDCGLDELGVPLEDDGGLDELS